MRRAQCLFQAVNANVKSHIRLDLGTMETMTPPPKPQGDKVFIHAASGDAPKEVEALEQNLSQSISRNIS